MKTTFVILFAASLVTLYCSCTKNNELSIEPISQEYNDRFVTGEGLDARYFSTKDVVQYYKVSGINNFTPQIVLVKLGAFTDAHYKANIRDNVQNLNVLFYREKWFAGYDKHLYESARDNENRTLEGHSDDMVAWITYERLKGDAVKVARTRSFLGHTADAKPLELRDTLALK
jgi:hypothetical protein